MDITIDEYMPTQWPHCDYQTIRVCVKLKSSQDYRLLRKYWNEPFEVIAPAFGTTYAQYNYCNSISAKPDVFRKLLGSKLHTLYENLKQD